MSVVIPTYNRGEALAQAVRAILGNDITDLGTVEVLIVDDGSNVPAARALGNVSVPSGFSLRLLRQDNGGPARARNTGFRSGCGDIVLFVDDDILAPSGLLRAHVRAHEELPGTVIFGAYPWVVPPVPGAVFRVLGSLGHDALARRGDEYVASRGVASGHLSVERRLFGDSVYSDDLETPGAEEYELQARLLRQGIPAFLATRIVALHDSAVSIEGFCRRQYKLGIGCAEAACRCPDALALPELARIITAHRPEPGESWGTSARKTVRRLLAGPDTRKLILRLARSAEAWVPQVDAFAPLYRVAIALYFSAGVRDGLSRYGLESAPRGLSAGS